MKKLGLVAVLLAIVLGIAFVFFRYEYVQQSVRIPGQNTNYAYDIVIRIDRLTGSKCLFEGGHQIVEIYDPTIQGGWWNKLFNAQLHTRYYGAGLCQ